MKDLLEAITIMSKYTDAKYPTHCEHDVLYFNTIDTSKVSAIDIQRLEELGFHKWSTEEVDGFYSYLYGSN